MNVNNPIKPSNYHCAIHLHNAQLNTHRNSFCSTKSNSHHLSTLPNTPTFIESSNTQVSIYNAHNPRTPNLTRMKKFQTINLANKATSNSRVQSIGSNVVKHNYSSTHNMGKKKKQPNASTINGSNEFHQLGGDC